MVRYPPTVWCMRLIREIWPGQSSNTTSPRWQAWASPMNGVQYIAVIWENQITTVCRQKAPANTYLKGRLLYTKADLSCELPECRQGTCSNSKKNGHNTGSSPWRWCILRIRDIRSHAQEQQYVGTHDYRWSSDLYPRSWPVHLRVSCKIYSNSY